MSGEDIKTLVLEKAELADANDYYGLLEVEADASKAQVQKAYFRLAKSLHPDRIAKHKIDGVDSEAARVFKVLSDAYNTLIDPAKRRAYDAKAGVSAGGGRSNTAELQKKVGNRSTQELLRGGASDLGVTDMEAAKIFSHKGAMLMKKGAFAEAEQFFRRAYDADPESARYNLQLGWAIYQNPDRSDTKRLKEARPLLEKAVALDEKNAEALYYMARVYKDLGEVKPCKAHLQRALAERPNFIEVKRELRLIEMRERRGDSAARPPKKEKSEGGRWPFGLDKLFKKK